MNIRFYVDSETRLSHIHRHGVDEYEVEDVLARIARDVMAQGLLLVRHKQADIYVPDPELDSVFVITAYELRGKSLAAYRRRKRRRQE